jgi:hypothetical protein
MNRLAEWRPTLAAAVLLAVLAAAYQVAAPSLPAAAPVMAAPAYKVVLPASPPPDTLILEPAPTRTATPADTVTGCLAGPLQFVRGSPASRRPRLVRRYVGTVGGQPATALLQWQNPDSIIGYFYLHRRGPEYTLYTRQIKAGQLVLTVFQEHPAADDAGEWRLPARPDTVLAGTWRTAAGVQPFRLRESYVGAARLAIKTTHLKGGWSIAYEPGDEDCGHIPLISYDFLHLLAPAGVPAALRPVLSPTRAARWRTVLASREADARVTYGLIVRLNDFGLLSYQINYLADPYGGRPQYATIGSPLFDLASGRGFSIGSQLRTHYRLALRRLIAQHLQHDARFADYEWQWAEKHPARTMGDTALTNSLWLLRDLAPLSNSCVLTSEGLELTYWLGSLTSNYAGSHHDTVLIPYRELRPLVRPGTPLARMLRARGLW